MKLLILSDLHFQTHNDWSIIDKIKRELFKKIKAKAKDDESVLTVVLGDIIDKGGAGNNEEKYAEADRFINSIKEEIRNVRFYFIPGNHEIKNNQIVQEFSQFCDRHSFDKKIKFSDCNTVFSIIISNFNLIFVDSNLARKHDADGLINIEELRKNMKVNCKNIIFMHHPPYETEGVERVVSNSEELISTHANFVFYGHQHGNAKVPDFLEQDTDIHSVGALFKQESGVKNEFLLLDLGKNKINYAYRYVFSMPSFMPIRMFPKKNEIKSHFLSIDTPPDYTNGVNRKFTKSNNKSEINERQSLYEEVIDTEKLLKENNLLLLLGDAGMGKSFSLANIYWLFQSNEEYFPIWVCLKNKNYNTVKEYIAYAQYNTIDNKIPVLIIDGLDEMKSEYISDFIRDIGSAVEGNTEVKIIISTRTNYKIEIEHFETYKILSLTDNDIYEIALKENLNVIPFMEQIKKKNCLPLAKIPFYLFDMIKIYKTTGTLPQRNQLLLNMIELRFKNTDNRFPCQYSESVLGNEYDILLSLKKLAFIMQAQHEYSIKNLNYTKAFDINIRTQLNNIGLLLQQEKSHFIAWEFEHNIFREYLVADLLKKISFTKLLDIITYDEEKLKLRPSWVNIISFLLTMRKDNQLKEWLIKNAKDVLCDFESDRLNDDERNKLFIAIMNECIIKCLPLYSIYNEKKLADYFQSKELILFMKNTLENPINDSAILSALSIICCFDVFYGNENELKIAIIPYLNATNSTYIVSRGIKAITKIFGNELRLIAHMVFDKTKCDERLEVVCALFTLFYKADVADEYSDFIFAQLDKYSKMSQQYSTWKNIAATIKSFKKVDNLLRALELLCQHKFHYYYKNNELFREIAYRVLDLFGNDKQNSLDGLVKIFVYTAKNCDQDKSKIIKELFCEFKVLPEAFKKLLQHTLPQTTMMFALEDIMEESLSNILIDNYSQGHLDKEVLEWYARRLPINSSIFINLNNAVTNIEGIGIQREPIIEWDSIQKKGNQLYFNCLFDKMQFNNLVDELISLIGKDIVCADLLGDSFSKVPHDRVDLENIRTAIYHSGLPICKLKDFVKNINWEKFSTKEICRVIQINKKVEVTVKQKKIIQKYFNNIVSQLNFEKLRDNEIFLAQQVILLIEKFSFFISDEKLLEMLMLPWYIFSSTTSTGESEVLKFVTEKISYPQKVKDRIIENICSKKLIPIVAHTHIFYCLSNKLSNAVDIAIELFNDYSVEGIYDKRCAVDYLIEEKGEKFIDSLVDDKIDNEFLRYLASRVKIENYKIIGMMVERNEKSDNQLLFLPDLIELNNRYALEKYLKLAKEANGLPDIHTDNSVIGGVTRSIREVNEISLIDIILKIFVACYSAGFSDKEEFGLKGAIDTVINNFIQTNKEQVKEGLNDIIQKNTGNAKLLRICHWHLHNIEKLLNISSDSPWNIEYILSFYEEHLSAKQIIV